VTALVKKVLSRNSETKVKNYYSNSAGFAGDGLYTSKSFSVQNQNISNTVSDLKRMLPFLIQGTSDNERIGESVSPISCSIQGQVVLNAEQILTAFVPTDLFVVIYVLEHVIYKDYTSLITGNNFSQLLTNGQNNTQAFVGSIWQSQLGVANQFYRLLKKKVVRLRYAGIDPAVGQGASIANSHDYQAKFSFTLTQKHMPKTLKYPEQNGIAGQNDPTNYAPFFCMGFYRADGQDLTVDVSWIRQQYTSILRYKDV